MVNEVAPVQIGRIIPTAMVGKEFTTTLPVTLLETQPFAFLTVSVYEYELPVAPPTSLILTVIGVAGKAALVTVVIPVPEIEYVVGVPVVPVYGMVNEVAPAQMAGLVLTVIVGKGFIVTEPTKVLALSQLPIVHEA